VKITISPDKAFQKIKHYCAYQERCHYEVKQKLFGMGLYKAEAALLLSRLIEEDYLNEGRFAIQFAGGHFRLKQWGKVKISYELKQKMVSSYNIKQALSEINMDEYLATLQKLAVAKWNAFKNEQYLNRQAKTSGYLVRKGYEPALVQQVIAKIRTGTTE
jgi:regulatory protein